jgi:phosphoribosyl 1,2-cyclic phosphodiesterase
MITFAPYASGSTGNIYTVTDGETPIMLDCGIPWNKIRKLLSFNTSTIRGVLLTHRHFDHCKGAKDAAKAGLDLYASKETFDALQIPEHRANEVKAGEQFKIGTWTILPFEAVHDVEGSLAFYMVNSKEEAFLYLTDSAYSPVRFKGLHVIAAECNFQSDILTENILEGRIPWFVGRRIRRSHFSLEEFIKMLKANDLSLCRELHLLHMSSGNADEAKMIKEVQRATGIPTYACGGE